MAGTPLDAEVNGRLLAYLQAFFHAPRLGFAEPAMPITGGFDTRIYRFRVRGGSDSLVGPLILRLFRREVGAEPARFEGAVLRAAAQLGFPAPRVWVIETEAAHLGAAFLVLDCVPGRVMLREFFGPGLFAMPRLLARAHLQLHQLEPEVFRVALRDAGCRVDTLSVDAEIAQNTSAIDEFGLDGLRDGLRWLAEHRVADVEAPVFCHGDFHPLNVLVERGRVTGVIDWSMAHGRIGPRAYDVGATIALMSHGPLDVPAVVRGVANRIRRWIVQRYVAGYVQGQRCDAPSLRYYEALRSFGFLIEAGLHQLARAGAIPPVSKPTAFGAAGTQDRVIARFGALTGVSVALPQSGRPR